MTRLNRLLYFLGTLLGALVIAFGILRFARDGAVATLLISLAIIIAGPIETFLIDQVRRRKNAPIQTDKLVRFIDLSTSIGFLICLGWAIYLI